MQLSIIFLSLLGIGNAIKLPNPSGPYGVALRTHAMTDNQRVDPYDPKKGHRQVLASIFWPINSDSCSEANVSYMPPTVAQFYGQQAQSMGLSNDTFAAFEYEVCKTPNSQKGCASKKPIPLAIFSPGAGNSRLLYSNMARSLASYGNIVVMIDHPYDADVIEFPNGKIIRSGNIPETTESLIKLTGVRAKDISFVISQVSQASFRKTALKGLPGVVDTKKIFALGHSLGGASAAVAALSDKRIRGGADLDGQIFEPALSKGLSKPFYLIGRPNHSEEDKTWKKFYSKLRGPKDEVAIKGTVHGSFTDFPQLIQALGLPESARQVVQQLTGEVDADYFEKFLSKKIVSYMGASFEA
ncbi:platelet-activating factor acetylhydrolase [Fusarium longipes]|uniref:1-alkyl-2-acetylglycerophosphocholine esterase n=1 Tax=Fusarium longipes TaxID=694270 RepID=A0A395SH41_9HYPO|nr:platelet-activating factor acetylhydrolase [Fusarium longipes]